MKILLVSSSFSGGGAEHVAYQNLLALLQVPGTTIGILTTKPVLLEGNYSTYTVKNLKETFLLNNFSGTFNYTEVWNCLNDFKPDIVHFHDFIPFGIGALKAFEMFKQTHSFVGFLTNHTYSFICTNDALYNFSTHTNCIDCIGTYDKSIIKNNCYNSHAGSVMKYYQKNKMKKSLQSIFDVHISPSYFLKKMFLKAGVRKPIHVLRNPCIEEILINSTSQTSRDNTMVFFGRISREKNIIPMVKAFAKSKTLMTLKIIGEGPQAPELHKLLQELNCSNIYFENQFLNTEKLCEEIKNATFMLLPSIWYENSPVSIVEAINLGIIPITSNHGGMKELVEFFGVGYLFEPTEENFIRTITELPLKVNHMPNTVEEKLEKFTTTNYKKDIYELYKAYFNSVKN